MNAQATHAGSQEASVILEPEAYVKALMHVLRFASNAVKQDTWCEVYGWLIGKLETTEDGTNQIVHVYDAVPIHHGKDIEVTWDAEAYVRAAEFDEQLFERSMEDPAMKNMFIVGWYHSHPGLDFFLSSTDIHNHLGFQGPNPQSIAVVFDHTKIVRYKHLGFKIYRLDEASPQSDFHEVAFDKIPFNKEMLGVVYMLQEVLEKVQVNQLVSPETGETPTVFSHLMLPGATPAIDKEPPIDLNVLFEKTFKSTQGLIQKLFGDSIVAQVATRMNPALEEWFSAFLPYLASSLNKWLLVLAEKLVITNKLSLGSVYTIAGTLEKSMKAINDWTKSQFSDQRRSVAKLLKESHDAVTGMLEKQRDETTREFGSLKVTIEETGKESSKATGEITTSVSELQERVATLEQATKAAVDAITGKVGTIETRLEGLDRQVRDSIEAGFTAMNARIDQSLGRVDSTLKEQVSTHVASLEGKIKETGDAASKALNTIVEKLAKERQELEELAASKAIKNMQKDLQKMAGK